MRPVEFGEALQPGTRLTLFSHDKPDRLFTVLEFRIDSSLGIVGIPSDLAGVPSYRVKDEEGRIHLLVNVPLEEEHTDQWWLWRPDQAGIGGQSPFSLSSIYHYNKHTYL